MCPFLKPLVDPYTDRYAFRAETDQLPDAPSEEDRVSLFGAALKLFNSAGSLFQADKHRILYDPNEPVDTQYDPFSDPALGHTLEMFPEEFQQIRNRDHALRIKARLDEETSAMQRIREGGMLGWAAAGAAAILDPLNLIPVGGVAEKGQIAARSLRLLRLASKADDVARLASNFGVRLTEAEGLALANRELSSITIKNYGGFSKLRLNLDLIRNRAAERVRVVARGGLPSKAALYGEAILNSAVPQVASEAALAATRKTYETEDFVYSAAAAGVIGGALGAFRARGVNLATRELDSLVARVSDELQNGPLPTRLAESGKLSPEEIAKLGPAKTYDHVVEQMKKTSPGTFDLVGENKLLRLSISDSPTGRLMSDVGEGADEIRAVAAIYQDHPALRRGTLGPSVSAKIEAQHAKALVEAENVDWLRRTARIAPEEFDQRVILNRLGKSDDSVEVKKAVGALDRVFKDVLTRAQDAGLLEKGLDNYYPRFFLWDAIQADQEGFAKSIAKYVGGTGKAQKITKSMLNLKDRALLDPTNFLERTKERGVFRSRNLENVPTEALLPYIDTDVPSVVRRYSRMTNAQIEYAKLTPGNPLDGLNMDSVRKRVGEIMDARIAAAKANKKESLIALKNRHLSDIEYIRKIHLGEFDVDQFDTGMHRLMRAVRGVASMVYLPYAGIASVQDTFAVAMHNSTKGFWGGSAKWLKRQLAEKVASGELSSRDLSRMARAAEYALSDMSRASLLQDFTVLSKAGRLGTRKPSLLGRVTGASDAYLTWNGMRPANVMARQVAINSGSHDILSAVQRRVSGAARKGDDLIFSQAGISDDLASRIATEIKAGKFEETAGFLSPRLDDWASETADDFSAAVFQNAKLSFVNPTAPVLPKWVKGEAGAMLFQFLSFPWASKNNYLINGYQRLIAGQIGRVAHGALMVTGFGLGYTILRAFADKEDIEQISDEELVTRAIDRTGVLSMLEVANDWLYSASGGAAGFDEFLGRKSDIDGLGEIPAFDATKDMVRDIKTSVNWFTGEPLTEEERKRMGDRIPFVNIPWIKKSLDAIEDMMR